MESGFVGPSEVEGKDVGHSTAWWTMIVLLALCPFGIPNVVRPWFSFYAFRGVTLPCFFDMVWWVVMTSCALLAGLSVVSRGETTDRRRATRTAWLCYVAQLLGIMGSYAPPSKFESAVSGLKAVALGCGVCGAWTAALSVFPMSRCSPMLLALGVPVDAALAWHATCGRLTVFFLVSHVTLFVISWSLKGGAKMVLDELTEMKKDDVNNVFGVCALACLLLPLFTLSLSRVRRTRYEWFYGSHLVGLVGFASFGSMHWFYLPYYLSPALAFWIVDLVRRYANASRVINVEVQAWYDASLLRLRFSSSQQQQGRSQELINCCVGLGSFDDDRDHGVVYASINVPAVSRSQYHPFTLVNYSKDGWECWVRARGDWTGALLAVARSDDSQNPLLQARLTTISSTGWPIPKTGNTILVAGGTGIAPFLSSFRNKNVSHLVWAIRHADDVSTLLLSSSNDANCWGYDDDSENPTELVVYFTGNYAGDLETVRNRLSQFGQYPPSRSSRSPCANKAARKNDELKTLGYLHAAAALGVIFGTVLAVFSLTAIPHLALWQLSLGTLWLMVVFAAAFTALALSRMKRIKLSHQPLPTVEALNPVYEMTEDPSSRSRPHSSPPPPPPPPTQAVSPWWSSVTVVAGRPDLEKFLEAEDVSCVMASGPKPLVESARSACARANPLNKRQKIRFTAVSYDISDL